MATMRCFAPGPLGEVGSDVQTNPDQEGKLIGHGFGDLLRSLLVALANGTTS